jgi:hypothetical protein
MLFSCDKLVVTVKAYPAGTVIPAADLAPPIKNGSLAVTPAYETPAQGDTAVVRAFYQWPLFVTGLGFNIADIGRGTSDGKKLLVATAAFRVEP